MKPPPRRILAHPSLDDLPDDYWSTFPTGDKASAGVTRKPSRVLTGGILKAPPGGTSKDEHQSRPLQKPLGSKQASSDELTNTMAILRAELNAIQKDTAGVHG